MKWRQAIYQIESLYSKDYKDTQQHEKRHKNHKKGPLRYKEHNILNK